MDISKYLLAFLLGCFSFGSLHTTENTAHQKKIYVNEKAIAFSKGGIKIRTNKGMVTTKAIHTNNKGIYFLESETIKFEEKGWHRCVCGAAFPSSDALWLHQQSCPKARRQNR